MDPNSKLCLNPQPLEPPRLAIFSNDSNTKFKNIKTENVVGLLVIIEPLRDALTTVG